MKKGSGFEKFFKGREATGAKKKEEVKQEKRQVRKQRESEIAEHKRQKRAQGKTPYGSQPPKYNLEPPAKRFEKRGEGGKPKPSFKTYKDEGQKPQSSFKAYKEEGGKKRFETGKGFQREGGKGFQREAGKNFERPTGKSFERGNDKKPFKKWEAKPSQNGPSRFEKRPQENSGPFQKKPAAGFQKRDGHEEGRPQHKPKFQPRDANRETQNRKPQSSNFKPQLSGSDSRPPTKNFEPSNNAGPRKPYEKSETKRGTSQTWKLKPRKSGPDDQQTPADKPQTANRQRPTIEAKPQTRNGKPETSKDEPMPLNKYIAHSGICSRRDAVDLVKAGKVKVNGELILEPGHKVMLTDEVRVAGRHLNPVKDFIYILLNKPKDYITTTEDPQERKTVLDLLKGAPEARVYPVGRLDRNTSGVLLLTNDGDLSQKLTHPSNEIKKIYAVTLDKPLTRHHFDDILRGIELEDGPANVDTLAYADAKDLTQIGVELHSGRNRIVRRIFEQLGYEVKALDRVVFAGLTKKNVNRGKWRFLTEKEVRDLKFFKKGR